MNSELNFDDDQDNLLNESLLKNGNLDAFLSSPGKSHYASTDNREND